MHHICSQKESYSSYQAIKDVVLDSVSHPQEQPGMLACHAHGTHSMFRRNKNLKQGCFSRSSFDSPAANAHFALSQNPSIT